MLFQEVERRWSLRFLEGLAVEDPLRQKESSHVLNMDTLRSLPFSALVFLLA